MTDDEDNRQLIAGKALIAHLLTAPDHVLDAQAKPLIEKWSMPIKAIEVLEVLDMCARYAWASGFVMKVLHSLLVDALQRESTTYEQCVQKAVWRTSTEGEGA